MTSDERRRNDEDAGGPERGAAVTGGEGAGSEGGFVDELPPEPPGMMSARSIFAPLVNTVVAPSRAFELLDEQPLRAIWLAVWVAVGTLGLSLWNLPISQRVMATMFSAQLRARGGEISAEQVENMRSFSEMMSTVTTWLSPLFMIVIMLILAGLVWMIASLMGKGPGFARCFAVISAGGVVHPLLYTVYASVVLHLDPPVVRRPEDMYLMTPTVGLDLLFPRGALPLWSTPILQRIDLFNIWWVVLVSMGAVSVMKLSRGQGRTIAILLWALGAIVASAGALFQSLTG